MTQECNNLYEAIFPTFNSAMHTQYEQYEHQSLGQQSPFYSRHNTGHTVYVPVKMPLTIMSFIIEDGCSRSSLNLAYQGLMNLRVLLLELPSTSSILKTQWRSWQSQYRREIIFFHGFSIGTSTN